MSDNENQPVKERRVAMIGKVMCVQCDPGDKIFDLENEKLLGIVMDRVPVINHKTNTVYLSHDDWLAAEAALPKPLKGVRTVQ